MIILFWNGVEQIPVPEPEPTPDVTPSVDVTKKYYIYKVYDGDQIVTTWNKDVISEPSFTSVINGMPGEMTIDLARTFEEYGENLDIKIDNRVDCIIFDNEQPEGALLYRGYITKYEPVLNKGTQKVRVTLFPLFAQSNRYILVDESGNTKVAYNSYDPSDILTDVYNKMLDDGATFVSLGIALWGVDLWDESYWDDLIGLDADDTGSTVSYTFNTNTIKEAIDKCVELAPANWYYRVDPNDRVVFKEKSNTVDHDLSIGINIQSAQIQQLTENMTNEIYFTGGGEPALFRKYSRTGSISQYGKYAKKLVDQRVTNSSTMDIMANKKLDEEELPETRIRLLIPDNNGSDTNKGYDIESIKVGNTLRIKNLDFGQRTQVLWDKSQWDVDFWDYTLSSVAQSALLITKIRYQPNLLEVETSSRFPVVAKRIEDINRNLETTQVVNNPDSPTEYS